MKQLGEKVLGWFVVAEDEEQAEPREEKREPAKPKPTPAPVLPSSDDDVSKVVELIASLPEGAPLEVKRAIVTASLEAFGIRVDGVVAAAAKAEEALDARALEGRRKTELALAEGQARIAELQAKIADVQKALEGHLTTQEDLAKSVAREKARLRGIGAFFGRS